MMKWLFLLIAINCMAGEVHYLIRSPRGLLMGDAYTTLATDQYSLFYNPALLGRNKGFALYPLPLNISLFDPTENMDILDSTDPQTTSELYDLLSGFPLHFNGSYVPTVKIGNFGVSLFSTTEANMMLMNNTHPMIDMFYRNDNGFAAGFAAKAGDFNVGFGIKYISRRGVQTVRSLYDPDLIGSINAGISSPGQLARALGADQGTSWSFDLGLDYFKKSGASEFSWGVSALDVYGSGFKNGDADAAVPKQSMVLSTGVSWRQDFKIFDYAVSADLHPINQRIDMNRLVHLGFEVGTPIFRFLGGYNAGYYSYGGQVSLGLIDVYAGFYDVEIGTGFKSHKANRFLMYASILEFDFDI